MRGRGLAVAGPGASPLPGGPERLLLVFVLSLLLSVSAVLPNGRRDEGENEDGDEDEDDSRGGLGDAACSARQ